VTLSPRVLAIVALDSLRNKGSELLLLVDIAYRPAFVKAGVPIIMLFLVGGRLAVGNCTHFQVFLRRDVVTLYVGVVFVEGEVVGDFLQSVTLLCLGDPLVEVQCLHLVVVDFGAAYLRLTDCLVVWRHLGPRPIVFTCVQQSASVPSLLRRLRLHTDRPFWLHSHCTIRKYSHGLSCERAIKLSCATGCFWRLKER